MVATAQAEREPGKSSVPARVVSSAPDAYPVALLRHDPAAIRHLQRAAGNRATARALGRAPGGLPPRRLARCGANCECSSCAGTRSHEETSLARAATADSVSVARYAPTPTGKQTLQRAAPAAAGGMAVLMWCLTGLVTTLALDEALQGAEWAWNKLFGRGEAFRQNWCRTVIAAICGCVFGVAGGAVRTMFAEEAGAATAGALLKWLGTKAGQMGYQTIKGTMFSLLARGGCNEVNVADVTPITPQQAQAQLGVTFDGAPDAESPAPADDSALAVV
jgi:hypothetical protein